MAQAIPFSGPSPEADFPGKTGVSEGTYSFTNPKDRLVSTAIRIGKVHIQYTSLPKG